MSLTLSPQSFTADMRLPAVLPDDDATDVATLIGNSTAPSAQLPPGADLGDDLGDEPALSSYARCADGNGTLSFLFFSDDDLELARAKAICRLCGLHEQCLSDAIERAEPYGVWGGKLILDGVPVEFKRKRGRPPKTPKPMLIVDEAPLPPHLVA